MTTHGSILLELKITLKVFIVGYVLCFVYFCIEYSTLKTIQGKIQKFGLAILEKM